MKVVHYVRVSTDEQGENYSIPGQLHELREHSASEGHEVVAEIVDKDAKRHNLDRPGLNEIRELAEAGRVGEVWAWAWDRFGQSPWSEVLALEMADYDVTLRSLDDGGPGEDAEILRGMKGLVSKADQDRRVKRSRMGKRSRARRGEVVPSGRSLPYGYLYNTDRTNYVPDPATMPVIRRMFEMIATGSSLHAIKTTLDREGVPTPRDQGPWNKITIRRYLLSDLYKPHTVEELRTLGVAEEVLRHLDHNKRYSVWWFGVDRVTAAKSKVKP